MSIGTWFASDDISVINQKTQRCQVDGLIVSVFEETRLLRTSHTSRGVPRGKKSPLYLQVAQRLLWLRETAGLAQIDLGPLAGVGPATISHIERGEVTSKISTIEQLATALGVSPVWTAFGEDGLIPWKERHRRFGIEPDAPPVAAPGAHPCLNLYQGMGERLRAARVAKGLSMRALGKQAGCTVAAISLLEAGTSIVLLSTCEELAKALDVAPGWLAYGIGAGPTPN